MQKNGENQTIQIKLILIGLLSAILILSVVLILQKRPAAVPAASTATSAVSATPEASASAEPEVSAAPIVSPRYEKQAYAPITVDNTTGFTSGWAAELNNSNASSDFAFDSMHVDVINGGTGAADVKVYREGIPFIEKVTYTLSFYASSSVNRNINAVISSGGVQLASQSFALTGSSQLFQLRFEMSAAATWNGRVEFDLGNDGSADVANEHTIDLTMIRITPSAWNYGVKTNQIGYQTNDEKRCTFSYDAGDVFDVINADTGAVVYSGAIVNKAADNETGETDCWGDFTNVTTAGTYLIRTQIGVSSYTFSIGDQIYDDLSSQLLKMLSLQRCGEDLDASWAGSLAHGQCHTALATVYGSSDTRDVTGGWHDAGDYGRYVKTGAKAVSDLLFAYLYDTNAFTDGTGTVQAGNNVADLLDESRYELEWMLKMQDTDGGVFNKVLTPGIADTILPDQDSQPLYVLETETTSTADFGGTMAVAAIAYKTVDPEFSKKCLDAAEKAETYLTKNTKLYDKKNPSDIVGGEYLDNTDTDGRFYTEMALWVATGDSSYLDNAKTIYQNDNTADKGISWSNNGGYGRYLFLMQPDAENLDSDFYDTLKKSLQE
jgi:endoglucanase